LIISGLELSCTKVHPVVRRSLRAPFYRMRSPSMMFRKLIGALGLAATMAMPFSAHGADVLAAVKERGKLVVGTETQFAPFDFIENGKHVGFNTEVFAVIGQKLGVDVEYVDLPWSNVLPALEAGKFDIVGGPLTLTKARLGKYHFNLPIMGLQLVMMKSARNADFTTAEDVDGRAFGVQRDTISATRMRELADGRKDVTVRDYGDNNQAMADLVAGRLDGVVGPSTNMHYAASKRPGMFEFLEPKLSEPAWLSFVGRTDEDSKSLMVAVDGALLEMIRDGSLAELQVKWFGHAMDAMPETLPEPAL